MSAAVTVFLFAWPANSIACLLRSAPYSSITSPNARAALSETLAAPALLIKRSTAATGRMCFAI